MNQGQPTVTSENEPFSGSRATGLYRKVRDLSKGGMGTVELAVRREGSFERLYAIKRMHSNLVEDESARRMFLEEARVAGMLRHPNVVPVLDVGKDEGGPYLVMEYVEGITVRDVIARAKEVDLAIPVQICARLIAQAAEGLAAAHALADRAGRPLHLVHRDVSPHNILVSFDGIARVADFGVARAEGRDVQTTTGVLKGKIGYMAPECLRFERPTAAADVFSLGIVLFELLTRRRLYGGKDDIERAQRILHDPPPDLLDDRHDVPDRLQALLIRMLAKEASQRPSGAEVARELIEMADGLAAEEGRLEVSGYVEETFGDARRASRSETQEALAALSERPPPGTPAASAEEPTVARGRAVKLGPRLGLREAAMVGAVIVLGVATYTLVPRARDGAPPEPHALVPVGEPTEPPPPAEPAAPVLLSVEITSEPAGARVVLGGELRGTTPVALELSPSAASSELRLERDGFEPETRSLVLDRDQHLHFALRRAHRAGRPPRGGAEATKAARPPAIELFDED